jgi:ribosome-binding protein aMBF1 (putative translation factor)
VTVARKKARRKSGKRGTTDAVEILDRMIGNDKRLRHLVEVARINVIVSEMIYEARNAAGLTQAALARRVGTTQSVISRLEDADYEGHSLTMLQRIAEALHVRLELRFVSDVA